MRLAIQEILPT